MDQVTADLHVVEYVELYEQVPFVAFVTVVPRNGRTLEEIARETNRFTFALITFKVLEGTAIVDGVTIPVRTERFDVSPYNFIGGTAYTLEEAQKAFPHEYTLHAGMRDRRTKSIHLRSGSWRDYNDEPIIDIT